MEQRQSAPLQRANGTFGLPVLLMRVGHGSTMFDSRLLKMLQELPTYIFATVVRLKRSNKQRKASLPANPSQLPSLKRLILWGQEMNLDNVRVIIEEQDEIPLSVDRLDRERPTNVGMHELQETTGVGQRGGGVRQARMLGGDAGLATRLGGWWHDLGAGGSRAAEMTRDVPSGMTEPGVPEIKAKRRWHERRQLRACGAGHRRRGGAKKGDVEVADIPK
jgi:hypothetical protein